MVPRSSLLVGAMLFVAACTTSGGDSASTKSAYISSGDSICRSFMTDGDALGQPSTVAELVDLLDKAIPRANETRQQLAALTPPADGADVHAALLKALDDSIEQVRAAREAAASGDIRVAGAALDEAVRLGATSDAAAKAYGFSVCGSEAELRSSSTS